MKGILRFVFLLIFAGCVFALPQCSNNEFFDETEEVFDEIDEIDHSVIPLVGYSHIALIARITYNSAEWSLCVMDKSGNNFRKIVDKVAACQKPVRSHSGTRLLFTAVKFDSWVDKDNTVHTSSEYELYMVNINGTGLTLIDRIGDDEIGQFGSVAWSPDDKYIIYVRSYDNAWDKTYLILYNISDSTDTVLQTEGNVCCPSFSPDGKQIAYCSSLGSSHHIYKMDVNGTNNQLIIQNASAPVWSPQGDKIVYTISGKDRSPQISVANADGSNQKQLTSSVSPKWWDTGFPRGGNSAPQWTPDGQKIVYVSSENDKEEIFIMNANGSQQKRLTKAEYWDGSPEVTPDGKSILFHSRRSDMPESGICIMNLNGSNQKVISTVGAYPVACK